jgi:hypothetical protein
MSDVKETVVHVDSNGETLSVDDRVLLKFELVTKQWNSEKNEWVAQRPFDVGNVESVNDDGTVNIWWDSAGCGCEDTSVENPTDLVLIPHAVADLLEQAVHVTREQAFDQGVASIQRDFRETLGLPHPSDGKDN